MTLQTLDPESVRSLVPMGDAVDAVRNAFHALRRGEFEMPPRTPLRDGAFLVMSAQHRPTATMVVKSLSANFDRRPSTAGTVVWHDFQHADHLVADAAVVTTMRTGAVVGVATDLLAPPEAATCTLIGAGAQAADQVRAVHAVRPLTALRIVDLDQDRADALAQTLGDELQIDKVTVGSVPDTEVRGVDLVCCATPSTSPLFALDSLAEHTHVNAIGAFRPTMRELPDELLADATVVIDELASALEESGEILHALDAGAITRGDLLELGTALAEGVPPRSGRTVFKSVGVAAQDWALANLLARRCRPGTTAPSDEHRDGPTGRDGSHRAPRTHQGETR
ncbi:ornithine cyclodeaminase family protein [Streptomyces sp. LHD-70]|uniref:ornithine cyclodeaminase family protein n=1 Tax=Streptomyces sp. LHD-70 TaxID=3072140 RepID=UPI00280CF97C|nr:ornithine cyclodeaminase family protein [Streptomyces sp. LHD-70]MDQ8708102.1 ornithine cyclodeaminase family protein [Streptomyces sp. LHD-70]